MTLSSIVLTRNEERNMRDCLATLSWADEILVVDSGSGDATPLLAEKCGARVISHPFSDFASQRNFAMEQAKGDWVLFIDADERVTPELAEEIQKAVRGPLCAYSLPFHTYFFGKRLRFGDACGEMHLRLFPRLHAAWTHPVHEQIETDLAHQKLKSPVLHYSTRDLAHYRAKVQCYVPRELVAMKQKGVRPSLIKAVFMPFARFLQLYFFKLGILDGIPGLQYAILSSYYMFEKHWRYWKQG